MNTTISERKFPNHMSGVSDGSVAGTHFYDYSGAEMAPSGVTVQQEGLSEVRIRLAPEFGIGSFVMGPNDTLTINAGAAG